MKEKWNYLETVKPVGDDNSKWYAIVKGGQCSFYAFDELWAMHVCKVLNLDDEKRKQPTAASGKAKG